MKYDEIEVFCQRYGFLFHEHGSGKFGANRYWTFYKVGDNGCTEFSIEYFPVGGTIKISRGNSAYRGTVESVLHLNELLNVMRIVLDESAASLRGCSR